MANPPGTHHHQEGNHGPSSFSGAGGNPSSNGNNLGVESSGSGLKHNPGISLDWTVEEQAILDEGLAKYAVESNVIRYAKIATQLQNKTVRDVALRCRWMNKKEISKRRKEDNPARKNKDKKERYTDPPGKTSYFMARPNVSPLATQMMPLEVDEGISYDAIGGVTGELLKQNAQVFNQISANLSRFRMQENFNLLRQSRDNICQIMLEMNDVPEPMKQMPPLPVKLNEDLADNILLPRNIPRQ